MQTDEHKTWFPEVSGVRETRNVVPTNQEGPVPCRVEGRTECVCDRQQRHECWPGSALHFPKGKRLSGHTAPRKTAGARKSILDAAAGHGSHRAQGQGSRPGRSVCKLRQTQGGPHGHGTGAGGPGGFTRAGGLQVSFPANLSALKTASFPTAPCLSLQLSPGFRVSLYDRL